MQKKVNCVPTVQILKAFRKFEMGSLMWGKKNGLAENCCPDRCDVTNSKHSSVAAWQTEECVCSSIVFFSKTQQPLKTSKFSSLSMFSETSFRVHTSSPVVLVHTQNTHALCWLISNLILSSHLHISLPCISWATLIYSGRVYSPNIVTYLMRLLWMT